MPTPKILQAIRKLKTDYDSLLSSFNSNKNSVSSTISNLENTIKSQINYVSKYHVPSAKKVTGQPTNMTVNPIPTTWDDTSSAALTYTSSGYTIESSDLSTANNRLIHIFDNSDSSYGLFLVASTKTTFDITLSLPSAIRVKEVVSHILDHEGISSASLLASNNKITWDGPLINLPVGRGLTASAIPANIVKPYKYYRWRFNLEGDRQADIQIHHLSISSYAVDTIGYNYVSEEIPDSLEDNQIVKIKTPSVDVTGVTFNTLNSKAVDTLLLPNRYYEFIYNSELDNYLAKEVV